MPDADAQPGGFYGNGNGVKTPGSRRKPKAGPPIPNPLNAYASYTYAWSLWWLDVSDLNTLMDCDDVDTALRWEPGPNSYVVAEDAGLYPNRRIPGILPVNYNIQEVNFTTIIAPNKQSRSSNMIDGNMTIVEPYGVTFVDSLLAAAPPGTNYTQQPYMLQLEFFGSDDNGNPIPDSDKTTFRKRFPIKLLGIKIEVSGSKGSVYKLEFCPTGHQGHHPEKATLPKDVTITADTVGTFFYNLSATLNGFYQIDAFIKGNAAFADSISFDIDPTISKSSIIYDKGVPLASSNPASKGFDLSKSNFNMKAGTSLLAIIDRVLAQSSFLIDQIKDTGTPSLKTQQELLTAYRTTVTTQYEGRDQSGSVHRRVWDRLRNTLPTSLTYKIGQYSSWKGESPHVGTLSDSKPYTSKVYNYLYTGLNTDVIDFALNFDNTYYTAVLGYTSSVPATQPTADTSLDVKQLFGRNRLNPGLLTSSIPNISPARYRYIVGDQNLTVGAGLINNPKAQKSADTIKSLYSGLNGDMINLDLKIIGDPSLIKQDDWLYIPSPTKATNYNSWDNENQAQFTKKYGHVRMDNGDLVVEVNINSPIDIDTEISNEGLMYPQMGVNGQYQSLFSGQYRIITISNSFSAGKFEQSLNLARIINSDISSALGQQVSTERNTEASEQSQENQLKSVEENSTDAENKTESAPATPEEDSYREE